MYEFLVKWRGYSNKFNLWIRKEQFNLAAQEMLHEYMSRHGLLGQPTAAPGRPKGGVGQGGRALLAALQRAEARLHGLALLVVLLADAAEQYVMQLLRRAERTDLDLVERGGGETRRPEAREHPESPER